jgi:hypothetical protein
MAIYYYPNPSAQPSTALSLYTASDYFVNGNSILVRGTNPITGLKIWSKYSSTSTIVPTSVPSLVTTVLNASKTLTVGQSNPYDIGSVYGGAAVATSYTSPSATFVGYTVSISPSLPSGLTLDQTFSTTTVKDVNGVNNLYNSILFKLSGTPSAQSPSTAYTIQVADSSGKITTLIFNLTVQQTPVAISSTVNTPNKIITVNSAVSSSTPVTTTGLSSYEVITPFIPVTASNGVGTLTYSISPSLPTGLSLNTSTGQISGTPTALLSSTQYTVTARDQTNATTTGSFYLSIISTVPPVLIATVNYPTVALIKDQVNSFIPVVGSGGQGTLTYSIAPSSLPSGLTYNTSTGTLSGTPTALLSSVVSFVVTISDTVPQYKTASFNLTVSDAPIDSVAQSTANTAQSTANTAQSTANAAISTANTAQSTANTAQSTANTALSAANTAQSTANTALSAANTAQSTANTAQSTACTATSTANTAAATANAAYDIANTKYNISGGTITGNVAISNTLNSTSCTTGALTVAGGVGIAKDLYVGGDAKITNNIIVYGSNSFFYGNVIVTGNLGIQGTTFTISSNNVSYVDSIIELHTTANNDPLTIDDGKDVGIRVHYYKGSDKFAFFGWANDSGEFEYFSDGTETSGVFSGTYGTIKASKFRSMTTADAPFIINSTTQVANLNSQYAGTVTTAAQPTITSVGTLTSLTVSGIIRPSTGNGQNGIIFPTDPFGGGGDVASIKYYANTGEAGILEIQTLNDSDDNIQLTASGNVSVTGDRDSVSQSSGALVVNGGVGIAKNVNIGGATTVNGVTTIANSTDSTSISTGALIVSGGLGVSKNLNAGLSVTANAVYANAYYYANGTPFVGGTSGGTVGGATNAFSVLQVTGQSTLTANSNTAALTIASGPGITLSSSTISNTLTISATSYPYSPAKLNQLFNANGSNTTFGLSDYASATDLLVTIDGIIQTPTTNYTVSGLNLTFDTAPPAGAVIEVRTFGSYVNQQGFTNQFTGTGYTSAFTLGGTPISANNIMVSVDGVIKTPFTDFTLNGTTLTFNTSPGLNSVITIQSFNNTLGASASFDSFGATSIYSNSPNINFGAQSYPIDSFPVTTYRTAKYIISVTASNDSVFQATEALLVHDGVTPQLVTYGTVYTGLTPIITFSASIASGTVTLYGIGTVANNNVKLQKTYVPV